MTPVREELRDSKRICQSQVVWGHRGHRIQQYHLLCDARLARKTGCRGRPPAVQRAPGLEKQDFYHSCPLQGDSPMPSAVPFRARGMTVLREILCVLEPRGWTQTGPGLEWGQLAVPGSVVRVGQALTGPAMPCPVSAL